MDVKSAVDTAKRWLVEVLRDENPTNVGLEEVEFDEGQGVWLITLGFSRPWNTTRNAFTAISGEPAVRRAYRVIAIKDPDGAVISMKKKDGGD